MGEDCKEGKQKELRKCWDTPWKQIVIYISSLQQQQPQSFMHSDYIGGKLVIEIHAKTRELPAKTDVGL